MDQKEIQLFNELKQFLREFNEGDYSTGDAMETLKFFYDKLETIEDE